MLCQETKQANVVLHIGLATFRNFAFSYRSLAARLSCYDLPIKFGGLDPLTGSHDTTLLSRCQGFSNIFPDFVPAAAITNSNRLAGTYSVVGIFSPNR